MITPSKEQFDERAIDSAFRNIIESKTEDMDTHFVYAGEYYYYKHADRLRSFILEGMKRYGIEKIMVTKISIWRNRLITKEKMESYCKGKELEKQSVNDDLEELFQDIQLGKKLKSNAITYFLPKLTKKELKLVETKDEYFMDSLELEMDADVDKADMEASESDSKFVYAYGERQTFTIQNL